MPTITLTKPFERHPSSVQNKTEAGLRWRVLIVDPHSSIREMIRMILDGYADLIEVAGEAADADEAVEQAKAMAVDLVLMGNKEICSDDAFSFGCRNLKLLATDERNADENLARVEVR